MTQTFFASPRTWHLSEMLERGVLDGQRKASLWISILSSPNKITEHWLPCGQEQGRLKGRSGANLKIELLGKIDVSVQRISISVQQDSSFTWFPLHSEGHYHFKGPSKLLASRTTSIISLHSAEIESSCHGFDFYSA